MQPRCLRPQGSLVGPGFHIRWLKRSQGKFRVSAKVTQFRTELKR